MTAITVIAILAAAATIYGFVAMDSCERVKVATKGKKKKYQVQEVPETGILFMVIMAVALIVRYIAAAKYFGNETDMNCFIAWGDMVFKDGIGNLQILLRTIHLDICIFCIWSVRSVMYLGWLGILRLA